MEKLDIVLDADGKLAPCLGQDCQALRGNPRRITDWDLGKRKLL